MRPRTIGALLAVTALLLVGCTREVTPQYNVAPTHAPQPTAAALTDTEAVYIAVLERYLAVDAVGGGHNSWPIVYVLDKADSHASDPKQHGTGDVALTPAEQHAITEALAGTTTITFISDRESVLEHPDTCPQVRGQAIVITLGTQEHSGSDLHVGITGFGSCKAATSLTYVLAPTGGWHVTGTTGPMAIA